jgi:hypothetical protein
VQPAAETDQRAGGPVDVPDPVQQAPPAAQRHALTRCPIDCSIDAAAGLIELARRRLPLADLRMARSSNCPGATTALMWSRPALPFDRHDHGQRW